MSNLNSCNIVLLLLFLYIFKNVVLTVTLFQNHVILKVCNVMPNNYTGRVLNANLKSEF